MTRGHPRAARRGAPPESAPPGPTASPSARSGSYTWAPGPWSTCSSTSSSPSRPLSRLWSRPTEALLETLESCLRLNEFYQEQYRATKDKLLTMPAGRQFDFSEAQIFGKFDLFCRRVIKLIDMFSTIQQFKLHLASPIRFAS